MISYPKPSEKVAEVREGGWEGEGREKSLSLSRGKSSSEGRKKQTKGPLGLGLGETGWPSVRAVEVLEGRLKRELGKGLTGGVWESPGNGSPERGVLSLKSSLVFLGGGAGPIREANVYTFLIKMRKKKSTSVSHKEGLG